MPSLPIPLRSPDISGAADCVGPVVYIRSAPVVATILIVIPAPPFAAFLALALGSAGHHSAALATMLGCALDVARPDAFDRYGRALTAYHRELLERSAV